MYVYLLRTFDLGGKGGSDSGGGSGSDKFGGHGGGSGGDGMMEGKLQFTVGDVTYNLVPVLCCIALLIALKVGT